MIEKLKSLINTYETKNIFSPEEAWGLFKITANLEAVGWTFLVIGIISSKYIFKSNFAVILAGRTHGTFFSLYIISCIILYPSLGWSKKKALIAGLLSVPPYGSIIFEFREIYIRNKVRSSNLILACYFNKLRTN